MKPFNAESGKQVVMKQLGVTREVGVSSVPVFLLTSHEKNKFEGVLKEKKNAESVSDALCPSNK